MDNDDTMIKSVMRSFTILNELIGGNGTRLKTLAEELEMKKTTLHSHIKTLEAAGFVHTIDDEYHPSLKLLNLGGKIRATREIYNNGWEPIDKLAIETNELVNLGIPENGQVCVVYMAVGDDVVHDHEPMGKYVEMHCTGIGKAILAHLPDDRVDQIIRSQGLPQQTENTITDREDLRENLARIRERGYAVDREEADLGISCIGVPILDNNEIAYGSVSISAPTNRINEHEEEYAEMASNITNIIELQANLTFKHERSSVL